MVVTNPSDTPTYDIKALKALLSERVSHSIAFISPKKQEVFEVFVIQTRTNKTTDEARVYAALNSKDYREISQSIASVDDTEAIENLLAASDDDEPAWMEFFTQNEDAFILMALEAKEAHRSGLTRRVPREVD